MQEIFSKMVLKVWPVDVVFVGVGSSPFEFLQIRKLVEHPLKCGLFTCGRHIFVSERVPQTKLRQSGERRMKHVHPLCNRHGNIEMKRRKYAGVQSALIYKRTFRLRFVVVPVIEGAMLAM
jgi:hypothetical protein